MSDAPANPRLLQAIAAFLDASDEAADLMMRPLLGELVDAVLVSVLDPLTLKRRGGSYLALFTDPVELHLYEGDAPWTALRADEAIKHVARGRYAGLVINPGARKLELTREDITDFFDIDEEP